MNNNFSSKIDSNSRRHCGVYGSITIFERYWQYRQQHHYCKFWPRLFVWLSTDMIIKGVCLFSTDEKIYYYHYHWYCNDKNKEDRTLVVCCCSWACRNHLQIRVSLKQDGSDKCASLIRCSSWRADLWKALNWLERISLDGRHPVEIGFSVTNSIWGSEPESERERECLMCVKRVAMCYNHIQRLLIRTAKSNCVLIILHKNCQPTKLTLLPLALLYK